MNPETGNFHELDTDGLIDNHPVPDGWPIFSPGEKVKIKGHLFEIETIGENSMRLVYAGRSKSKRRKPKRRC